MKCREQVPGKFTGKVMTGRSGILLVIILLFLVKLIIRRHAVAQLVEALCYEPESRGVESRLGGFFFNLPNPSGRTMALGSTQPLTEMSTRNLRWGKGWPARKAYSLTAICEPIV
jgi:hypothetical protein